MAVKGIARNDYRNHEYLYCRPAMFAAGRKKSVSEGFSSCYISAKSPYRDIVLLFVTNSTYIRDATKTQRRRFLKYWFLRAHLNAALITARSNSYPRNNLKVPNASKATLITGMRFIPYHTRGLFGCLSRMPPSCPRLVSSVGGTVLAIIPGRKPCMYSACAEISTCSGPISRFPAHRDTSSWPPSQHLCSNVAQNLVVQHSRGVSLVDREAVAASGDLGERQVEGALVLVVLRRGQLVVRS